MSDVTRILESIQQGGAAAADLLPLVYTELRRIAAARMAEQAPGQTLQPTALVHEAWVRLTGNTQAAWNGREHFLRAAAQAMRQILVDRARAKQAIKRGADRIRVEMDTLELAAEAAPDTLLLVDEALERLAQNHPGEAELVKLRFYMGMSVEQTAQALGVSEKTVKRQWAHARAWLFGEITRSLSGGGQT